MSRGSHLSAGCLPTLDPKDAFSLQTVEILSEATAICEEVVPLHSEHQQRVDFIEGIENAEEVSRMAMGCNGKEVA